jgi:hypothetical protein
VISPAPGVLVLLGIFVCVSSGQTPISPAATQPQYSFSPITDYNVAVPNSSDELRFRRSERYNIPNSSLPELGEDSDAGIYDLPATHFKKNAMPIDASDTVVVGTVTAGQSFLSNDKRDLYSEFKVALEEIIENSVYPYRLPRDSIEIQRKGGVIRLQSGKVLTRAVLADSMPQIGGRYLFFLKYDQYTEDYAVLNGYQLYGGQVYRLDDLSWGDSNHPQTLHPLLKEELGEDQFLARARSTVLSQKKQN